MYQYKAEILRVIDGDTVEVRLEMGLHVFKVEKIRLCGIDAPERGKPGAREATQWLSERLFANEHEGIYIETVKQDKYGRFLGWFYESKTDMMKAGYGDSLNIRMVNCGLAKFYSGGKRKNN